MTRDIVGEPTSRRAVAPRDVGVKDSCACAADEATSRSMRRSAVLLAGAMVVAGGAALLGGDDRAPAASIKGAPLDPSAAPARARLALAPPGAEAAPAAPAAPAPLAALDVGPTPDAVAGARPVRGSAPMGSLIDLDEIVRVADHYEAPLKDGRRAVAHARSRAAAARREAARRVARAARRDRRDGARRPHPRARRAAAPRSPRARATARSTGGSPPRCGRPPRRCSSSSPRARSSAPASMPTTRSATTAACAP